MHLPEPTGSFENPPEGTHLAVCYRVIDQGTQDKTYQGKVTGRARKVTISWELSNEKMEDGRPFTIHQTYTLSMNEKATLRKHLEAWRGKRFTDADFGPGGFDLKKLLCVGCLLTITHNTKSDQTYANLSSVSRLMKDMQTPEPINPVVYFSMEDQETFNETVHHLESFGENLTAKIKASPEYGARMRGGDSGEFQSQEQAGAYELEDDIPF